MIDTKELRETFIDCFFHEGEANYSDAVIVEGITRKFGFNPKHLSRNEEKICGYINELDPNFSEGVSFLAMPFDKNKHHWGDHSNCEELMALSIALGLCEYILPREMWSAVGGVPYLKFKIGDTNA